MSNRIVVLVVAAGFLLALMPVAASAQVVSPLVITQPTATVYGNSYANPADYGYDSGGAIVGLLDQFAGQAITVFHPTIDWSTVGGHVDSATLGISYAWAWYTPNNPISVTIAPLTQDASVNGFASTYDASAQVSFSLALNYQSETRYLIDIAPVIQFLKDHPEDQSYGFRMSLANYTADPPTRVGFYNVDGGYGYRAMQITVNSSTPAPSVFIWNQNASGDWNTGANWIGGVAPTAGAAIEFGSAITADQYVASNVATSAKSVKFDNVRTYTVAGKTLTLTGSGANATITVLQGSHEFQAPVTLGSNTDVAIAAASALTFNGALDLAGNTLTKNDAGTLFINNKLTTGTGGQIVVNAGDVNVSGQLITALGAAATNGEVLTIVDNLGGGAVNGTFAGLPQGALLNLSFGGTDYPFQINYTGGNGNDVTLTAKLAIPGDCTGDGYVDDNDLGRLLGNWGLDPAVWADGNFNTDTVVDDNDLGALLGAWGNGTPPGAVPEPVTLSLLALGGAAMLRRRK